MSKMTDEQIIKHIYGCENKDCRVIVIFNKPEDTIDEITIGDIADVINRQQAEIERLKAEIEKLKDKYEVVYQPIAMVKAEAKVKAYKEFAERLKKQSILNCGCVPWYDIQGTIDNIVKEMVGDDK